MAAERQGRRRKGSEAEGEVEVDLEDLRGRWEKQFALVYAVT